MATDKLSERISGYSKWSLAGIIVGAIFSLGSFVRYFVIYPDPDRAFVYTMVGIIIMFIFYLYNERIKSDKRVEINEEAVRGLEDVVAEMKGE